MRKQLVAAATLLAASGMAHAEAPGHFDLFFVPSAKFDVTIPGFGSLDDDGDGFGIKGQIPVGETMVLLGEYQGVTYDDTDIDVDQLRIGLGSFGESGGGFYAEYASIDLDGSEADGIGLHLRLSGAPSDAVTVYGQIGYLMLNDDSEDISGLEILFGGALNVSGNTGVFVEMRKSMLEGADSDVEFEFTDLRAGLRIGF